jgi:hypothetical protein
VSSNLPAIRGLRLYQVSIYFEREPDTAAVQNIFRKAIAAISYMPGCWLVLTNSDAQRWYARLMPLLGDGDAMVICEVHPSTISGWIQESVVDWIIQARERIAKSQ